MVESQLFDILLAPKSMPGALFVEEARRRTRQGDVQGEMGHTAGME